MREKKATNDVPSDADCSMNPNVSATLASSTNSPTQPAKPRVRGLAGAQMVMPVFDPSAVSLKKTGALH
jgi:hypothetical protein